ncbi:rare lipoprotein A [Dysgonomonas sp. PH5-45]|uniref:septal ring lytic transglycosylase RlpA family protein n=1 Tax=unclassified Dysgonomonas TaxID=2630389 RepID=UPI002475290E|nr:MULTISPECIES: septal ring lytic transglycosylase RlpA family protein [unclassified Dysgonomonas]MDH6353935.1 rare lipoprotein A [Dysgonomonas sp. PH5-45]MDH6386837.1 rare lipoprotein A [Dysgonomonas sp. PH5-37]
MKKIFILTFLLFNVSIVTSRAQKLNIEEGLASYYSKRFHLARTASGELYHNDSLICAHRTHPFGTLLEVLNEKNGKSVIVRVVDRGPHRKNRIIDLSYAAAERLDIVSHGLAHVKVLKYEPTPFVPIEDLEEGKIQPLPVSPVIEKKVSDAIKHKHR